MAEIEVFKEAIGECGCPEIFNTDQGIQFASNEFTQVFKASDIKISMDDEDRWVGSVSLNGFGAA